MAAIRPALYQPAAAPEPVREGRIAEMHDGYVAELGRLGDLLQLTLNDQARADSDAEAGEADIRAHSVIQVVQDRLSQLAGRIETDLAGGA